MCVNNWHGHPQPLSSRLELLIRLWESVIKITLNVDVLTKANWEKRECCSFL